MSFTCDDILTLSDLQRIEKQFIILKEAERLRYEKNKKHYDDYDMEIVWSDEEEEKQEKNSFSAIYDLSVLLEEKDNYDANILVLQNVSDNILAELQKMYSFSETKKTRLNSLKGDKIAMYVNKYKKVKIKWKWFHRSKEFPGNFILVLNENDVYISTPKASGYDWRKRKIPVLKHIITK